MSVQRTFAQHNNNKTSLLPVRYSENLDLSGIIVNISNAAIYTINISKAEYVGGIHIVDLSQPDSSGNVIDVSGTFTTFTDLSGVIPSIPIVCFVLNIDTVASAYPGKEITIFFKNILSLEIPFVTIGILANTLFTEEETIPFPYIVSPPFPPLVGPGISSSITLKSDGDKFNVVSSGPAGWLGVPALSAILSVFQGFNPEL
jgi:hypothetical protein